MNIRRKKGIEKEILRVIGYSLITEVKMEKISNLVSVHSANLSPDGRYLELIFTVLNYKENINKEKLLEDLNKLKGFFKSKLKDLKLRNVPDIKISIDETLEYSIKISNLLDKIKKEDEERKQNK